MTEQEPEIIKKYMSGQELGNPNPPSLIGEPHQGHKADADSWTRTKNKRYLKKRARQLILQGSTDRGLFAIIATRRQ